MDTGGQLPSFLTGGDSWVVPGLVVLAMPVVAGLFLARRPGTAPPRGAVASGISALFLGAPGLVGWAWWQPPPVNLTVLGQGRGGAPFRGRLEIGDEAVASRHPSRLVWAAQRDATLKLAPRLPAHRYRLTIRAGAQGAPGPTMAVTAGGTALEPWTSKRPRLPADVSATIGTRSRGGGGRLPLRVEFRGVTRGASPHLAYLDTIRLDPLGP